MSGECLQPFLEEATLRDQSLTIVDLDAAKLERQTISAVLDLFLPPVLHGAAALELGSDTPLEVGARSAAERVAGSDGDLREETLADAANESDGRDGLGHSLAG